MSIDKGTALKKRKRVGEIGGGVFAAIQQGLLVIDLALDGEEVGWFVFLFAALTKGQHLQAGGGKPEGTGMEPTAVKLSKGGNLVPRPPSPTLTL